MSANCNLPTGQYCIRNGDAFADRNRAEDLSLNPKEVFCPTDDPDSQLWDLVALPNCHYILKARGAPTGVLHKHLYAFLVDEAPEQWVITQRESAEHLAQYTIENASQTAGWVAEKGAERPQIAVRPLIVGPSEPPHFPPNELWNIQPLVT